AWCMDALHLNRIKADCAGFGALGAKAVAKGLLGVLRQQLLELGLGLLMVAVGCPGAQVDCRALGPQIGGGHVDDFDGCEARTWRLDAEQERWLAALHAAPELLFCG